MKTLRKSKPPVLQDTLERLKRLYEGEGLEPGRVTRIAIKPQWNVLAGTGGQCGMALNFSGKHDIYGDFQGNLEDIKGLLGRSLLDVVEENLTSPRIQQRSMAMAALSALSLPFLDPASLSRRGFFVQEGGFFPTSIIKDKDVVAVVGYGGIVEDMIGKCQELHITDMRPKEIFQSVIIGKTVDYGPKDIFIHSHEENKEVLGDAHVVVITGSSLINDTFEELAGLFGTGKGQGCLRPQCHVDSRCLFQPGNRFYFYSSNNGCHEV